METNIDISYEDDLKYKKHRRHKKRKIRKAISYIISIILSLCIILVCVLGFISNSLLNEVGIRKAMKETNYYYNIYGLVKDVAHDYVLQSGFDENVLDNVITEAQVQGDINKLLDCIYNNKKVELDTDNIRKTLNENIQKQIKEKNYTVNKETQKNIDEFEDSVIQAYKTNMYYSKDVVNKLSNIVHKIRKAVIIAMIIISVIIIILGAILFKINEPAIGISCIISGAILIIIKTFSIVNIAINNILILNWAFSRTLIYILNGIIKNIFVTGIILSIVGIIVVVLTECMKYAKAKSR